MFSTASRGDLGIFGSSGSSYRAKKKRELHWVVSSGLLYWMAWLAFGRCGTTSFFRFPLLVDTPEIPHKLHFDLLCIGQKFHLIVLFAKARLRLVYLV